ncbi:MAG: aminotransferase-like domain-containing protein [Myxococcales bacterium]
MIELAKRMSRVHTSPIREMLKVTERPDVLSFAGGLPAPEAFPVAEMARAHADVLAREGGAALQYGATEGFGPLRAWVADRVTRRGLPATPEQVLITAGSQQGLDLVGKALIDPGDVVVVEAPSYLAALQSFSMYEARFAVVDSDDDGMRVDELERLLRSTRAKLIYLVPNFQNPRGTTLSLERRLSLVRLAAEHGVAILEDDPYGELRWSGAALPPIAGLDANAGTIHLGSFSKTLAPGLRLGYAVADERTIRALVIAKQAADLHTGVLSQRAVARLLETFDYDGHLRELRALYGERCAAMMASIERSFPAGTRFTRPEGGLFVWAQIPGGLDAAEVLEDAMREKVAFVPGAPFYPHQPRRDTMRLNFSNCAPERIAKGMAIIGACVARRLDAGAAAVA